MQALDFKTIPLTGIRAIEASAGTGKTYSIAKIYLRLILGLRDDNKGALPPSEILVLTFTEAATSELRARIGAALEDTAREIRHAPEESEIVAQWRAAHGERDLNDALVLLTLARRRLDKAEIHTIHSFCIRLLGQYALEARLPNKIEVTLSQEQPLNFTRDYWRTHVASLDEERFALAYTAYKTPDELYKHIEKVRELDDNQAPFKLSLNDAIDRVIALKTQLQDSLNLECEQIIEAIETALKEKRLEARSWTKTRTPQRLAALREACEHGIPFENLSVLEHFMASVLIKKTAEGKEPPTIFDFSRLLDKLKTSFSAIKLAMLTDAIFYLGGRAKREESVNGVITTDRAIVRAADFVANADPVLLTALRDQYPIALIDEFQDTDARQWEIFKTIYQADSSDTGLMLIGDPKQAIYQFRGADLNVYLQARDRATPNGMYSMTTNYRSTPEILEAVESLMCAAPDPFMSPSISFTSVGAKPDGHDVFTRAGKPYSGLDAELVESEETTVGALEQSAARQTAHRIHEMLYSKEQPYELNGESLKASDIAVLVRNAQQAQLIQRTLLKVGITASLNSRESVFNSTEAQSLLAMCRAIREPKRERHIHSMIGAKAWQYPSAQLAQLFADENLWQKWHSSLVEAQLSWNRFGPMTAIRQLMDRLSLHHRLSRGDNGHRAVTNWWQLVELLQETATSHRGIEGVIEWLTEAMADSSNHSAEIRLDADDERVQIMTIHASKGLQFPAVFLPFGWQAPKGVKSNAPNFVQRGDKRCLMPFDDEQAKEALIQEHEAEDARITYVALTRAKVYLHVLFASYKETGKCYLSKRLGILPKGNEAIAEKIEALSSKSFRFVDAAPPAVLTPQAPIDTSALSVRTLERDIEANRTVTSYSGLTRHYGHGTHSSTKPNDIEPTGRFALAKGAHVGNFLHDALENMAFEEFEQAETAETTSSLMLQHGVPDYDNETIVLEYLQWLNEVVETPFINNVTLKSLPANDQLAEMEFLIPINGELQSSALIEIVGEYLKHPLEFDDVRGHLKGYIDLSFRLDGKYYVADYKSNHLGDTYRDYEPKALEEAVAESGYTLQFLIYALAMHRHLRSRLPEYTYETHFGGVYYFYLRGMHPDKDTGIYFHRPPESIIEKLDELFSMELA